MAQEIAGQVVCEYLEKFPNTSSLGIARKLRHDNPQLFTSIEHARQRVRYYRGADGNRSRKKIEGLHEYKKPDWKIPTSDSIEYTPFIIPTELQHGLVIGDLHIPYHDKNVIEITLEFAYKHHCDFILLHGDIVDFYQISRFCRDPRKRHLADEIILLREFLLNLSKSINAKIFYKFGNHEERWDAYVMQHAPELFGLDAIQLENVLKLNEYGITPITLKRIVKYRHLAFLHGHEYRFSISNPVNPARGLFLRTHDSTLVNHFHQTSEHSEPKLNGELLTCWSVGCLCHLHPEYMPLNKWNHGFAILKGMEDKYWRVENKKIIEGKIV